MELLVVIAIIGILVALLLPAIQAAREAARRSQCKNNLKQLALGCLNHHDVHKHFPTGGWGWFWVGDPDRGFGKEQPGGWIFNILPYIEESALHQTGSDGDPIALNTRIQMPGARTVVESPITIINCPSRRATRAYPMSTNLGGNVGLFNAQTPDFAGRSDYAANSGHARNEFPPPDGQGPVSYAESEQWLAGDAKANFKLNNYGRLNGTDIMTGISFIISEINIRRITDGTTKTYLVGERYIPSAHYETGEWIGDNETWCTGFNNDNYRRTGRISGASIIELSPVPDTTPDDASNPDAGGRFGSAHAAVWQTAMCDGSVTAISYEIDWQVHRDLGNREDGNVTNP